MRIYCRNQEGFLLKNQLLIISSNPIMVLIIFLYMDFGAKALVRFLHNERGMDAFDVLGMQL